MRVDIRAGPPAPEMLTFTNICVLDLRFFKVFAPVQQAPYIADNFGNMASCPDGGQLPARYRVIKPCKTFAASCSLRPLAASVAGFTLWGYLFPLGRGFRLGGRRLYPLASFPCECTETPYS